ncbi:site-specific DNA-methyltransferase [Nesterenkonia cremea]|uniref:site-specific DNA-methyltransferase n=1 Tax=Nesterenkonia cremea TaxID=1882340 RepID=UPI001667BDCD|nr:DNA methyltransferase [Nesterenkonia cremea]
MSARTSGRRTAHTTVLDAAIAKVRERDPNTAQTLEKEVRALRQNRRFGLVFDRHLPELVSLPEHPVLPGCRVTLRAHTPESKEEVPTWRVQSVEGSGSERRVTALGAEGEITLSAAELVVVREFDEPIYPGLRSVQKIDHGADDDPNHVVISGENHHALQMLHLTHRSAVDLIYIDPPYNTGNKGWIYNDRYVQQADPYKHSKWLSFMEKRLRQARGLLKDAGVIMVAIGDDEHHRLRMLMDQIFGKENFISDVVWQGGRKNDARYVSNGADYMLVYARRLDALGEREIRWREEKPGVHEVLAQGEKVWAEHGPDEDAATAEMRAWFKKQPKDSPVQAMARNVYFLPDGRLCRDTDISWPGGGGETYDVLHPATGKPVPVPSRGWAFSSPERMQEAIDGGWVIFRKDHTKPISLKRPLIDTTGQVVMSVFERQRTHAGRHVQDVLGDKRFPFPKDHEVLMRWIRLAAPQDAVVLDFFGGSGSTAEAVIRLNAEDGGSRQSILVTNNELSDKDARRLSKAGHQPGDPEWEDRGVFRYVTRPRLATVVTGERPDGSRYSEGIPANLEFFEVTYLQDSRVRRDKEFRVLAPLLWLGTGARGRRIDDPAERGWDCTDRYAVLADIDAAEPFLQELNRRAQQRDELPEHVYVITGSSAEYAAVTVRLPGELRGRTHRLYDDYLRHFENLTGDDA